MGLKQCVINLHSNIFSDRQWALTTLGLVFPYSQYLCTIIQVIYIRKRKGLVMESRQKGTKTMRFRWLGIIGLMVIFTYISSVQVTASEVVGELQVGEQTRQILMQKYGLEPAEESQAQQRLLSGDWGMSFRYNNVMEPLDKLMRIVPYGLWPAVWIFRMWV